MRQSLDINDHVGKDKTVRFVCYADGKLYYMTEEGLEFPVPIDDTDTGVFLPEDRSIYFMRWIRKHIDYLKFSKYEADKTT